jgi:cell division protease FtsH
MQTKPAGGPSGPNRLPPSRPRRSVATFWLLILLTVILVTFFLPGRGEETAEISFGFLYRQLEAKNVASVKTDGFDVSGRFKTRPVSPDAKPDKEGKKALLPERFVCVVPMSVYSDSKFSQLLFESAQDDYQVQKPSDGSTKLIVAYVLVAVLVLGAIWYMLKRTRDQVYGGPLSGVTKSPARRYESTGDPITFADVAGMESVKAELQEIVDFLKNPSKFQRLGGRIPKGVLLMGPPGTGKTLLGRAVAGEADVPFFSINGSEFIQLFVGVGASRVRDLFATAKQHSPSILFVDEIDAVGRHRGTGVGGGHDEREQTLNQILSEMDGFSQTESVIVVAATNRPDVLDPALLRPGRFDRHVTVDRPNHKGRLAIFRVHCRDVPLADDVDLERLAAGSVGLTGADIRNLVNEAALWATKHDKDNVGMADFEYARDKVLMGIKREEVLTGKEKSMTAFHEAGHALMVWLTPSSERIHKITIIPRGRALGGTQLLPEEDRLSICESELHNRLAYLLGGRAAERIEFDELDAGAEDDLKRATQLARRMVAHWGMSERVGPVAFRAGEEQPFLGREIAEHREFSEHTARMIDEEVVRILRQAADRAEHLLRENQDTLRVLAAALEREEVLDERQIEALIGPPAIDPRTRIRQEPESPARCPTEAVNPVAIESNDRPPGE